MGKSLPAGWRGGWVPHKAARLRFFVFLLLLLADGENGVHKDAEDERGGDVGDGDFAEVEAQPTDAGDEDGGDYEKVAVLVKVNVLEHPQAGYRNEAVQRDAHAAHYASGNGVHERYERSEEAEHDTADCRCDDCNHGGVAGNRYAADAFTVGGVGAAAEERADHGADAVAQQRAGKARFAAYEILTDDGRKVLMVRNVLCEHNKGNGHVQHGDGAKVGPVEAFLRSLYKCKLRNMNPAAYAAEVQRSKRAHIEHLKIIASGSIADDCENARKRITGKNADDEGDKLGHFFAEGGAEYDHKEGDKAAEDVDQVIGTGGHIGQIADGAARKGKTDDGNGWPNDDRGHELVDPAGAERLDGNGDEHVHKARKNRAHDDAEITECRGGIHGGKERKGTAQEYGALCFGESDINAGSHACAKKRCCDVHLKVLHAVGIHQHGNNQRCCHDSEHLLECKYDELDKFGFVFDAIDQVHVTFSFFPCCVIFI